MPITNMGGGRRIIKRFEDPEFPGIHFVICSGCQICMVDFVFDTHTCLCLVCEQPLDASGNCDCYAGNRLRESLSDWKPKKGA